MAASGDYISQQDLLDRLGADDLNRLADLDGDDMPDAEVLQQAIDASEGTVNAYVGKAYALPLAAVPDVLKSATFDIVVYNLHQQAAPEIVIARYKEALAFLKDVATGKALIDVGGSEPESKPSLARFTGPKRIMSRDGLGGF